LIIKAVISIYNEYKLVSNGNLGEILADLLILDDREYTKEEEIITSVVLKCLEPKEFIGLVANKLNRDLKFGFKEADNE
jgi:hypothetical protein